MSGRPVPGTPRSLALVGIASTYACHEPALRAGVPDSINSAATDE